MLDVVLVVKTLSFYQTLIGLHSLCYKQTMIPYLCSACSAMLDQHVGNTRDANRVLIASYQQCLEERICPFDLLISFNVSGETNFPDQASRIA